MNSFTLPDQQTSEQLPREIYISFVSALYGELRSLIIGSVAATGAALLIAWKTGNPYLYASVALILAVATYRAIEVRRYRRSDPSSWTQDDARDWEAHYVIAAAAYVALLSTFCMMTFLLTDDAFSQMLSLSMVIAYHIGVSGRNYAHDKLIDAQILCSAVPLAIGLISAGGYYPLIGILVLLPLFVAMRRIAAGLKNTLVKAVSSASGYSKLASRFDTALTNMPHGLVMFDAQRRAVVLNQSLRSVLGTASQPEQPFSIDSLDDLIAACPFKASPQAERLLKRMCLSASTGRSEKADFPTDDGRFLSVTVQGADSGGFVVCFEDITERRSAEEKVEFLATFDSLTGLLNRNGLDSLIEGTLAKAEADGGRLWVMFIDLDNFKRVNDTLGHHQGDNLLREVARRLTAVVGQAGKTARFGGDEFVVCLPSVDMPTAVELAEAAIAILSKPYQLSNHSVALGASVGVAVSGGRNTTKEKLLRDADTALYQAKADGKGIWRAFEPEMAHRARARQAIETDIRKAVEERRFHLAYQPLVDMKSRHVRTFEALLRWDHPERGSVSPQEFIPVVEDLGLIVSLGRWVLETACLQCLKWPEDIRVAVNLSSLQFRDGNFLEVVRQTLKQTGLPASRLELEITESVLLHNEAGALKDLAGLSRMGVRLALDDFGTGYSSLSYLRWLKLDKIKIDRAFVRDIGQDPKSLKLIAGIVSLAKELGLSVTVEGVETRQQLALLEEIGQIDELQGYLFSKPLHIDETLTLIASLSQKRDAA
ncbi:putative bifunctional diguanylate cyclase/phosphodiesterase [Tianweitania sediminis]|uniref:EAL domain-containing protein n=1 Tax=Tianweitania sediminis TaxID=1502156 RepID=A0A8J7R9L6_9HYPH|nr:EAL domain-containing protein [Tianweitania sediminis]MBP0441385.1 EAL domain-containing protein [Tianweitania sediminis]